MKLTDECGECGDILDPTKRIYRGPGGKPRCAFCQCLADCRLEIRRITTLVELMAETEAGRVVN